MKFAYDIPGYVQGHRFSDEPEYYNSTTGRFTDLAGGDRFDQYVSKVNGTPAFADRGANSRRGLYLDNTNHWQFPHACPWEGSGVLVAQYNVISGAAAGYIYSHIFAEDTGTISNNPMLFAQYYFGNPLFRVWGAAAQLVSDVSLVDDAIMVFAWSRAQDDRIARVTTDGVSITVSSAYNPTNTNGNFIGLGGQPRCRLGNIDATGGTTASTQGTMHIFEQHFFKTNILRDHLADTKAFIDTLKTYYRAT